MKKESLQTIEKKKYIVDCAVKLMDGYGFKNVTVQDICKAAGISVGSFYHYFSSKDSIVKEMYYLMDMEFVSRKEEFLADESSKQALKAFVSCYAQYILNWGEHANLLVVRNSLINPQEEREDRVLYDILIEIIEKGQQKKEILSNISSDRLGEMIFTQMRGHSYVWAKDKSYNIENEINTQIDIFIDAL